MLPMAGVSRFEQAAGMEPVRSTAPVSGSHEAVALIDWTEGAASQLLVGASQYAGYEQKLDRLRAIRARDLPDRMRQARGFAGADAVEEIAHAREDHAAVDACIARLGEGLRRATTLLAHARAAG